MKKKLVSILLVLSITNYSILFAPNGNSAGKRKREEYKSSPLPSIATFFDIVKKGNTTHLTKVIDKIEKSKKLRTYLDAKNKNFFSPLHIAVEEGKNGVIQILLSKGANINDAGPLGGMTPLLLAAQNGNTEIFKFLLDKGANPNTKTKQGYTAFRIAQELGYEKIVRLLFDQAFSKAGLKK